MPRPLLLLIVVVALVLVALGVLAALDREVPQTRVEQPVADAPPR